jgi:hypothetical protein
VPGRSTRSLAMRNALSRTLWFCLCAAIVVIVYQVLAAGRIPPGWRILVIESVVGCFAVFGISAFFGFFLAEPHMGRRWEASALGAATGLAATWRPPVLLWKVPDEMALPLVMSVAFAVAAIGGGALRRWSHG